MPEYRISVQTEYGLFEDVLRTEKDIDQKEVDVQTQSRVDAFVSRIKNPPPAPPEVPPRILCIREDGSLSKGDLKYTVLVDSRGGLHEEVVDAVAKMTTAELLTKVTPKLTFAVANEEPLEEKP